MAEPIDPHGSEKIKPSAAPKLDESSADDPCVATRSTGQADRAPEPADDSSGTASSTTSSTAPSTASGTPEAGGEVVPVEAQAPETSSTAEPVTEPAPKVKQPLPAESLAKTRAAAAWLATGAALIILGLIIILILQNQETVEVNYLWFSGSLPLGAALLIAAVAGAAVVMIVGTVRLTQVRRNTRRVQKAADAHQAPAAKG